MSTNQIAPTDDRGGEIDGGGGTWHGRDAVPSSDGKRHKERNHVAKGQPFPSTSEIHDGEKTTMRSSPIDGRERRAFPSSRGHARRSQASQSFQAGSYQLLPSTATSILVVHRRFSLMDRCRGATNHRSSLRPSSSENPGHLPGTFLFVPSIHPFEPGFDPNLRRSTNRAEPRRVRDDGPDVAKAVGWETCAQRDDK